MNRDQVLVAPTVQEGPTPAAPGNRDVAVDVTLWGRVWPALLAVVVVGMVGTPAAVASYRHARHVVESVGDPVMAPWLPLSVDGMLLAALVVVWVRRHRGDAVGKGPWAAFVFGMVVTVAANLAAVSLRPVLQFGPIQIPAPVYPAPTVTSYVVALFPPLALGIALELVALVAYRTRPKTAETARAADAPEEMPESERASLEEAVGVPVRVGRVDGSCGVYRLLGEADQLLYVGIADVPYNRVRTHRRRQPWWSEVVRIQVTTYKTRAEALAVEQEAIATENPKYNAHPGSTVDTWSPVMLDPADRVGPLSVHDEPLPVDATNGVPASISDDDLVEGIRVWIAEEGSVPSRERVRIRYGIGSKRADRVRNLSMGSPVDGDESGTDG